MPPLKQGQAHWYSGNSMRIWRRLQRMRCPSGFRCPLARAGDSSVGSYSGSLSQAAGGNFLCLPLTFTHRLFGFAMKWLKQWGFILSGSESCMTTTEVLGTHASAATHRESSVPLCAIRFSRCMPAPCQSPQCTWLPSPCTEERSAPPTPVLTGPILLSLQDWTPWGWQSGHQAKALRPHLQVTLF